MTSDPLILRTFLAIFGVLVVASLVARILEKRKPGPAVANLVSRIHAWWIMAVVFAIAIAAGPRGATILFALLSFLAFREFITLTPSALGDHRALFWAFFVVIPAQYWLVWTRWYGLFSIFIPVYAFLWTAMRIALAGDARGFLERTARIQWGLMVCVFFVSHAPMLLSLEIPGFEHRGALLLLFLVLVVQSSDVFQYVWGKLCGRRKIAPVLSPNKTVEGLAGGTLTASALGAALWPITPFTWWQAGLLSLLITVIGFFGGLVMSAIKRDRGVKDYGSTLPGHGGIMDRIDSLCFAAPVFFHFVRYYWT
jgi:phosphatidate cytidylyltransferase